MNEWIEKAERLEAQADVLIRTHPNDWQERLDRMCWRKCFAWLPVKLMDSYYGRGDGKWRWLVTVERHVLEPVYRDVKS